MCASPLQKLTALVIVKSLVKFFSTFGQTDQGTNSKSEISCQALKTLQITPVTSSPYHTESQGALEQFHQTMKSMLLKNYHDSERDWGDSVPRVLSDTHEEVVLGFTRFQSGLVSIWT